MMREAILKAADHIERNPSLFHYGSVGIPGSCRSHGCALGWINYFSNTRSENGLVTSEPLGFGNTQDFYKVMDDLIGSQWRGKNRGTGSPRLCVKGLRLFADKYFPATPDWEAIAARRTVLPDAISEDIKELS